MAREFARKFYDSAEWHSVRSYVLMRDKFLCQHCGCPAEEVHHKKHLSPENIGDTSVTLNPANLVSLCRACHFAEHREDKARGHRKDKAEGILEPYEFDENGYAVSR